MSTAVEVTGFVMAVISFLVTGASLSNDYWKISTVSGSVIISQRQFENLWHACAENSAGIAECRDFDSLLGLPAHVQACRALMIISLLFGLGCIIVSLLGLKCIKIGSTTEESKAKIATTGGILSMLGGLCCIIACSWYGYQVVQDFHNPFNGGVRFELGTGLYLGWAGGALAVLGGALLCTACKRVTAAKKGGYFGKSQQKVYTATAKSDPDSSRAYV
ncbi:Claudin-15 [Oryzias melastigma]|uniref:Claudin n=1 Tax=Oryzias melastigma TaxID=30732 RepID=A0A3B3DYY4_ORYME|nr:claudin 15-like a [Oryzias melastigma]KAF6717117.1 Claudin-15 [Oryzias melastigma]KAF6720363.1 Claudin-15 [Oryzias melastigma]